MAFAAEESGQFLSQDAQGRMLVSRERRESLLEKYDRSGILMPLTKAESSGHPLAPVKTGEDDCTLKKQYHA